MSVVGVVAVVVVVLVAVVVVAALVADADVAVVIVLGSDNEANARRPTCRLQRFIQRFPILVVPAASVVRCDGVDATDVVAGAAVAVVVIVVMTRYCYCC